jgi:hypothetical protein
VDRSPSSRCAPRKDRPVRTIARNATRIIAALRPQLTTVTRHHGANDLIGTPVAPADAWDIYDNPTNKVWPLLRELDRQTGVYEIRVSGRLRYELRRPAPSPAPRIDIVVDRDPDGATGITVYLDGVEATGSHAFVHHVDPGADGADHAWLEERVATGSAVPKTVRLKIAELASTYHRDAGCTRPTCDG